MKNKKITLRPLSYVKQVLNDIKTTEREIDYKEKEFYKEWNKWGKPKIGRG